MVYDQWKSNGQGDHSEKVVANPIPTSEVGGQTPNLIWESWKLLTDGQQVTVQNLDQLYVLVSSAHKTNRHDMTCTALKTTKTPAK